MNNSAIDTVKEILQLIGEISLVLIPIATGIWYKVRKSYKKKIEELRYRDEEQSKQELLSFSHRKSLISMKNLNDICNMFFDRSRADRVSYFQLENGTMADSQLQNMFITCMAESNRYSMLPEWINQVQRMPVQSIISFIETVNDHNGLDLIISKDIDNVLDTRSKRLFPENISALRVRTIHNASGYIVGYVFFEYLFESINEESEFFSDEDPNSLINECRAAMESELLRYCNQIKAKKDELKIQNGLSK